MFTEEKPRVLVVDRQLSSLTWLDSLLSRQGCRVTPCCSPGEALKAAGQKPDLAIVGSGRTRQEGEDLIRQIKALSPETAFLLLLEPDVDPVVEDAIAAGADGLLRRSYSESQVIQRVDRLLHADRI